MQWKAVVGYEGVYEVSDRGDIRSLDRRVGARYGSTRLRKGKLLRPYFDGNYFRIRLFDEDGEARVSKLHLLVLEAFVGSRPPGMLGLHENDDRSNNRLSNLYWGTQQQNAADAVRNGKQKPGISLGSKHGHAKLTEADIPKILEFRAKRVPFSRIAEYFGVTDMTIHDVVKGVTWRHVTGGP